MDRTQILASRQRAQEARDRTAAFKNTLADAALARVSQGTVVLTPEEQDKQAAESNRITAALPKPAPTFGELVQRSWQDPDVIPDIAIADALSGWNKEPGGPVKGFWAEAQKDILSFAQNDDELEFLSENVQGPQTLAAAKARILMMRENAEAYSDGGFWKTLGANLVGGTTGSPLSAVLSIATAGLFRFAKVGSGAMIAQGRAGAAATSVLAENALVGVALEGAADLSGRVKGFEDYMLSAVPDMLISSVSARGAFRAAAETHQVNVANRIAKEAVETKISNVADPEGKAQVATVEEALQPNTGDQVIPPELATMVEQGFNPPPRVAEQTEVEPPLPLVEGVVDTGTERIPTGEATELPEIDFDGIPLAERVPKTPRDTKPVEPDWEPEPEVKTPPTSYTADGSPIPSLMVKTGGQLGSNPGAKFLGTDGVSWYVKKAQSAMHAANEALVSALYNAVGIMTPSVKLTDMDGSPAIASKWLETAKPMTLEEMRNSPQVRENFAVDALLANWDVVGTGGPESFNLKQTAGGMVYRIEGGGGLLFRATGGEKGHLFTDGAEDLMSLRNPAINPEAAQVFADLTLPELEANLAKLQQIGEMGDNFDKIIDKAFGALMSPKELVDLMVKLENRRLAMQSQLLREIAALKAQAKPDDFGVIKKTVTSGVGTEGVIEVTWATQDANPNWVKETTGKGAVWEGTVHDLLKLVTTSKSGVAKVYKDLAKHLLINIGDNSLKGVKAYINRTKDVGLSSMEQGVQVPGGATVSGKLPPAKKSGQSLVDDMDDYGVGVILHETMHAISQSILHLAEFQPGKLSKDMREVVKSLDRILEQLREKYPDYEGATSGVRYAAKDKHELLSQFMNDRETIQALLDMPAVESKTTDSITSVFMKVLNAFRKMMGVSSNDYGTAYRQVAYAVEFMLTNRPGVIMSNGLPLATLPGKPPEGIFKNTTNSEAFKKWFGKSQLVDEDGEPLLLYHGTGADAKFAEYKKYHSNGAIFITTSSKFAKQHSGGEVLPVYVRAENLYDNTNPEHLAKLPKAVQVGLKGAGLDWVNFNNSEVADALKAAGFDGWWETEGGAKNLAVFDNDQIKSAFNDGSFSDPANVYGAPTPSINLPAAAAPVNPVATVAAKEKFAKGLYAHARAFMQKNPIDMAKLRVLTSKFGSMSDGLRLAKSENPIMQMVASLVVETTTGAAGRKKTAALRKHMLVNQLSGKSIRGYRDAYSAWLRENRKGLIKEAIDQEGRIEFDREVMIEILKRRETGGPVAEEPNIRLAADHMQDLFTRSLDAQKKASVLGASRLPENSVGYVPQALSGNKLAVADAAELKMLQDHLSAHFVEAMGWGDNFSKQFAAFYLNRARQRALNTKGVDVSAGANSADVVRDTLEEMSKAGGDPALIDAALKAMAEFSKAGMGQTKKRLDVGLLHELPNGKLVMDYYETGTLTLARRYVNRTAGTVALTEVGIHGAQGVRHLREAITAMGEDVTGERRARQDEIDAFDRVMGEMLGGEIPGEVVSNAATNLATFTRLAQLGGMGITQFAETFNAVGALGLSTTLKVVANLPKMLGEVGRVKRGQDPMNHVLTSLEVVGGPIGMESYNLHVPLEADDRQLAEYVRDSGVMTRILSGLSHAQAKISLLRGISAAQHRAVAEQITLKAMRYIRDVEFSEDGNTMVSKGSPRAVAALEDMGFTRDLVRAVKDRMDQVVEWDSDGRVTKLDITKMETVAGAQAFVAAVHRGTSQIIQQTYVGERAHWMHNDYFKLLAQMRTFGVTATEKQWGRTRHVHGYSYATGMLMAQMAMVLPLHMARVQAASVGREDREEYIKQNLAPTSLIRATLNYSSLSGLSGDLMEQLSNVAYGWAPDEYKKDLKEGLAIRGTGQGGVASIVPALGVLDRGYKAATGGVTQKNGLYNAAKLLPGANLPYVIPVLNMLKEDE